MAYETDTAKRYQHHAEELRVIAGDSDRETTRKTLLAIARDYEKMASTLMEIDLTNRSVERNRPIVGLQKNPRISRN